MILRQRGKLLRFLRKPSVIVTIGILATALILFFLWTNRGPDVADFYCGAEVTVEDNGIIYFENDGSRFMNGKTQSSDVAHSGKFSSRVGGSNHYGLGFATDKLKAGQTVVASIWIHSEEGGGEFVVDGNWGVYQRTKGGLGNRETGWEQLTISIDIPVYVDTAFVKFYAYCPNGVAYYDDLNIRIFDRGDRPDFKIPEQDSIPEVNLIIAEAGIRVLEKKRLEALKTGMLITSDDSWVNVQLETKQGRFPAKARLKGDWVDHLKGKKWSFRIEMKEGYAWNRMVVFSFQNPRTRSNLDEWVYHKLLDDEGVLTPRYDFLVLKVNGENRGVYAYEEHFVKQLPEYHKKREGPILKFSEAAFWDAILANEQKGTDVKTRLKVMQSPPIIPFGEKRTAEDSTLRKQFEEGHTLMYQFLHAQRSVNEIFDVEKLARYIALVDITQAHHGFIWHNQRWYYDPIAAQIEPVAFDGYTPTGPLKWIHRPFIGFRRNIRYMNTAGKEVMFERFFVGEEFMAAYTKALQRYTSPEFIRSTLDRYEPEIQKRERLLRQESFLYQYDRTFIAKNAQEINHLIYPKRDISVRAFKEGKEGGVFKYKATNLHSLPVRLTGFGNDPSATPEHLLREQKYIAASAGLMPHDYVEVNAPIDAKYIFFEIPGIDSTFSVDIYSWKAPGILTARQELFQDLNIATNDYYTVAGNEIIFRIGKFTVAENIIIPKGYKVFMNPGTELNFVKKAKFISRSTVYMVGSEDQPIRISSSDSSMQGFTVLNAWDQSILEHVYFDHLNTLNYKGWTLTGAVTFYESNVKFSQCHFASNKCEDGLNLVRCYFQLEHSTISNTAFDGLDVDFSEGSISNCLISGTGNDGLDFSGSKLTLANIRVENANDKALSVGEESNITVGEMHVDGAAMGAVSKDLSVLKIDNISLKNVTQGFAAYVKKSEYGPAKIIVEKYSSENVKVLHNIEKGSELKLEGEQIKSD